MTQAALVLIAIAIVVIGVKILRKQTQATVKFVQNNNEIASFTVELADNMLKRASGLMFRKSLPEDHGMLFIYQRETKEQFWMKNTSIPLDIIFIDGNYTVVDIAKNTTPYSLKPITSQKPFKYALEVNAGLADKHGIKEGTLVELMLP